MKKIYAATLMFVSVFSVQSQTAVCPNGDMESVNICFGSGAIFSYWSDGCTDPYINPSSVANSGATAMLITNDLAGPSPISSQSFPVTTPNMPVCITFSAKINLNGGDTVKFRAYMNCNGAWVKTADWYYTNPNNVNLQYSQYQVANNTGIMCITGMDSMKIELIGGKVMNGNTPTSFWVDDIILDCTTGINSVAKNNEISVFPNPTSGIFSIALKNPTEKSEIEITDVMGKKIFRSNFISEKNVIDLSKEAKGIYFYSVLEKGKIVAKGKLILE